MTTVLNVVTGEAAACGSIPLRTVERLRRVGQGPRRPELVGCTICPAPGVCTIAGERLKDPGG